MPLPVDYIHEGQWPRANAPEDEMPIPEHLGGHCYLTHTDEAVLRAIVGEFGPFDTVLDIGCGPGHMAPIVENTGMDWVGIDGDPNCQPTYLCDYEKDCSDFLGLSDNRILGWSVEFLEHISEKDGLHWARLDFGLCNYVFITHALPGQGGHHHVNCQPPEYWVAKFDEWGFDYLKEFSENLRANVATDIYTKETGMVFKRRNRTGEQDY